MKNIRKTSLSLITAISLSIALISGCGSRQSASGPVASESAAEEPAAPESAASNPAASDPAATDPSVSALAVMHEEEFGGVYLDLTIDAFNDLGFSYGDGVTVTFSNGYALDDIPYYNGYYTQNGEPLLVAYPGYPYIKVCINNGDDLWSIAGLTETDTADISLAEPKAYLDIQDARNISYKDDWELFASDAVFANFRSVRAGNIRENTLYRAASPCDNQHNRAPYVDALIAEAGVNYIVNLADNEEKIAGYLSASDFDSPYFLSLYETGNVIPLALNMNFSSEEFCSKVATGLTAMAEHAGPYLVHCTEGKDRTGFVCLLLEALCGADYGEIEADYMITYENYYDITKDSQPERYAVIVENVLDPMIRSIAGGDDIDLREADLEAGAEQFLKSGGMSPEQIAALRARLTGG